MAARRRYSAGDDDSICGSLHADRLNFAYRVRQSLIGMWLARWKQHANAWWWTALRQPDQHPGYLECPDEFVGSRELPDRHLGFRFTNKIAFSYYWTPKRLQVDEQGMYHDEYDRRTGTSLPVAVPTSGAQPYRKSPRPSQASPKSRRYFWVFIDLETPRLSVAVIAIVVGVRIYLAGQTQARAPKSRPPSSFGNPAHHL